jgi:16S rRNA G527 N7-methylase RsmG
MKPQIQLEMIESRAKRGVFLEVLVSALGMKGTLIHNARLDVFLRNCKRNTCWDCVSWKALKLGGNELKLLRDHAHKKTQFWMFHGKELAVTDLAEFERSFRLRRREKYRGGRMWFLSIYDLQESAIADGGDRMK